MTAIHPPSVSAVIPTRNRPALVLQAVKSALDQSYTDLEIIVVIDGPDASTEAALGAIADSRLRVLTLPVNSGAATARNIGVKAARGKWIAFLDDDDEWLPEKIAKQVKVATESKYRYPIVACQVIARAGDSDAIWPRIVPTEPLCEYLLARNSLAFGEGLMATTTLFVAREVFERCLFRPGVEPLEDWDWVLRSEREPGVGVEFLPAPLAIWNIPPNRSSLSSRGDWEASLRWAHEMKDHITPRAYAGFIAGTVSRYASDQNEWHAFLGILRDMMQNGAPKTIDYVLFFMRIVPKSLRRKLANV